ncbi:hypothetical protein GCM10023152_03940 [Agromyces bauzanensis]|uniref:Uncharacterized protein n=1 Tax=Agromyces bauzanensis TaxID=1308924 RepID=A0A917PD21_9MICO|nr:hypothetical protein GCM10011372_06630 [Agromyces bauzanensis]
MPPGYVPHAWRRSLANHVTHPGIVCADKMNGQPSIPTWSSPEGLGLVPEAIPSGSVISREASNARGLR